MANTDFLSAREKRDASEMALSDYSLSFSLSRYSKVEGTRKAFQILMHAAPDMQILPASDTDNVLETLECAGDIPRDMGIQGLQKENQHVLSNLCCST